MNSNFLSFSSFQPFPIEIIDLIVQNSTLDSNIHFTKKAYYQNFIHSETDQKIGLYGENLVLRGMKLQEKLNSLDENIKKEFLIFENKFNPVEIEYSELLKNKNLKIFQCCIQQDKISKEIFENSEVNPNWKYVVQGLFYKAMANPEGYSKSSLETLSYASNSATEALAQLNKLPLLKQEKSSLEDEQSEIKLQFSKDSTHLQYLDLVAEKKELNNSYIKKKHEEILYQISDLSQMKKNEKFIYEVCGGKSKFHDLKILVLDPNNTETWSNDGGKYINRVKKRDLSESVMRGIVKGGRPFLAIKYSFNGRNDISIFFQRSFYRPDDWFENGKGLLGEYNGTNGKYGTPLGGIMSKSNQHGKGLYDYYPVKIALKTLLTTGICQAPNKPTYKLVTKK